MTQQEPMEQPEQQTPSMTVGIQLREARIAQNRELGTVANLLRLDVATLQALENDDHQHLPEPIFVRGYIQNYARLLCIDVEPLLASYNTCAPSEPKLKGAGPNTTFTRPSAHSNGRTQKSMGWMPLLAFGVVIGGIVAVWAYWPLSLNIPGNGELEPEGVLVLPERETEALSIASDDAPPVELVAPNEVMETASAEIEPIVAEGAPIIVKTESVVVEPKPVEVEMVVDRLVLKGDSESWVTIHDQTGERLMYGMLKSGVTREIEGVAPFRVLLGFARGVEVSINDESFDVTPHIKENSARFIVDRP